MRKLAFVAWLLAASLSWTALAGQARAADDPLQSPLLRGMAVKVTDSNGKARPLYKASYALVVGNGDYSNGWDRLPGAVSDVAKVAKALERNGFEVVLATDLDKENFDKAFATFMHKYGRDPDHRLLFYYAGHGFTKTLTTGEKLGYLVMVDAPRPEQDDIGFELKAVDMQYLFSRAKLMRARHVLYMFDSCFSGSILTMRDTIVPEGVKENIRLPVRQFITAGNAEEAVPDKSHFAYAFIDLLEGRAREPFPDGYLTGEELGYYLKHTVPRYNPSQHPQYGKINNPQLDKGDFVFVVTGKMVAAIDLRNENERAREMEEQAALMEKMRKTLEELKAKAERLEKEKEDLAAGLMNKQVLSGEGGPDLEIFTEQYRDLKARVAEKDKEKKEALEALDVKRGEYQTAKDRERSLLARLTALRKHSADLKASGEPAKAKEEEAAVPALLADLDGVQADLARRRLELNRLKAEYDAKAREEERLKRRKDALTSKLVAGGADQAETQKLAGDLKEAREQSERLERQMAELTDRLAIMKVDPDKARERLDQAIVTQTLKKTGVSDAPAEASAKGASRADGRIQVAVFPVGVESEVRYQYDQDLTRALNTTLEDQTRFNPAYSYYPLDEKFEAVDIGDVITPSTKDKIWLKKYGKLTPDVDLICALARKMHVDVVLTYAVTIKGKTSTHDSRSEMATHLPPDRVRIYVIDVKTRKMTSKYRRVNFTTEGGYTATRRVTTNALEDYLDELGDQ